jgi:hypothetical protein
MERKQTLTQARGQFWNLNQGDYPPLEAVTAGWQNLCMCSNELQCARACVCIN